MTVRVRDGSEKRSGIRVVERDGRRLLRAGSREAPIFLVISGGFAALLVYAVINPWTPKLEFPFYRGLMALVALGLVYFVLKNLVNATTFQVKNADLVIEHGPLPPRRHAVIALAGIERIGYAPLRGVYALYADGTARSLAGSEDASPELAKLLVEELGIDAKLTVEAL